MRLPKPIKKAAIKIIDFVRSVPILKKTVKRILSPESRLYQKLHQKYHNAKNKPVEMNAQTLSMFEHTFKTLSLDQLQIFYLLLNHDDMLSEGVYDENCN